MTNEDKAKYYDQLLREHDQKASRVANLQNKIDLSREDKAEIKIMIAYVFDVDGTLTPSRLVMDQEFSQFFTDWLRDKKVFFVTGSNSDKTIEQVGLDIWKNITASLQSCGNQIFVDGKEVYKNEWEPNEKLISLLEYFLMSSDYRKRTSNHIEERVGLLNFSVVGRDCTQEERENYYEWDKTAQERVSMVKEIMEKFPELEASVGGQISIDIHPKGANKGQAKDWILNHLGKDTSIYFYGDKTEFGGNDYDLAKVLAEDRHKVFQVSDWEETYKLLKK
jgi:phosphomannomutase